MTESPVLQTLAWAAREYGPRAALSDAHSALTFASLWQQVEQRAQALRRAEPARAWFIRPGEHVVDAVVDFFACLGAGITPILGDPAWNVGRIREAVAVIGTAPALAADCTEERLPGRFAVEPHDLLGAHTFVRFTSGSTGSPKAILFEEGAMLSIARAWGKAARLSIEDRVLCLATINNGLAFNTSLLAVLARGAMVRFSSGRVLPRAVLRLASEGMATVLVAFPLVYDLLGSLPEEELRAGLTSVRFAISSAAELSPAVQERWRAKSGIGIGNYFGAAEVGPATFNDGTDQQGLGGLLPEVRVETRAADGGLSVWTPWMGTRYVSSRSGDDDGELTPTRPFELKDVGVLTEDGRLRLTGRLGSVLNLNGIKVDARAVERAISHALGGVTVVVTVRVGDASMLVAHVESTSLTQPEVHRACGAALEPHAVPRLVFFYNRLPRSSAGKVLTTQLR